MNLILAVVVESRSCSAVTEQMTATTAAVATTAAAIHRKLKDDDYDALDAWKRRQRGLDVLATALLLSGAAACTSSC